MSLPKTVLEAYGGRTYESEWHWNLICSFNLAIEPNHKKAVSHGNSPKDIYNAQILPIPLQFIWDRIDFL